MYGRRMQQAEDTELSRSIGAVVVDPRGALLVDLVTTDGESFFSALTPLRDIAANVTDEASEELYKGAFWLVDMCRSADGHIYACDADGNVHTNVSGAWVSEPVTPGKGLRVVRVLADGSVFAAGATGTVYRRRADGWHAVGGDLGAAITGLDGRTEHDLAICGDAGLVATLSGERWSHATIGEAPLSCVLAVEGGYLVGGPHGALYRGVDGAWRRLGDSSFDFHGLASYRGETWAACGSAGTARVSSDGGVEVMRSTFAAYSIHAAATYIAFAGNLTAVRFDGTDWKGRRYG